MNDRCPDCGAQVEGGREGCQKLMDQMRAQAFNDLRYAAVVDLAFDAYCMQHVDQYCRSPKSYAAHLTRLCCGIEYERNPSGYAAIQRWLNGSVTIEKPHVLAHRGSMTIADAQDVQSIDEHVRRVRNWPMNVWAAYAEQHEIARAWIELALGNQGDRNGNQTSGRKNKTA